eukprot:10737520-Alexandrium_andersonii.AAC.1
MVGPVAEISGASGGVRASTPRAHAGRFTPQARRKRQSRAWRFGWATVLQPGYREEVARIASQQGRTPNPRAGLTGEQC